jgi:hypothetical protein
MIAKCALLLVVGAALASCAGGCAEVSIAAVGTTAGIAASAISTGGDVYRLGKLDTADEIHYDQWVAACRAGAGDLHYTVERESDKGYGKWLIVLRDDRRSRVDIHVDRRTETLCLTHIDVGLLGSEPTARLILTAIRRRAGAAAATRRRRASAPRFRRRLAERKNGEMHAFVGKILNRRTQRSQRKAGS